MASLITAATKVGHVRVGISRRSTWNPRLFVAGAPRFIQAGKFNRNQLSVVTLGLREKVCEIRLSVIKKPKVASIGAALETKLVGGEHLRNLGNEDESKCKEMAGQVGETAQDVSEKAKQTLEGPWGSAKDTTQKAKESLMGNAEASKETVKQHAEEVKKNMNMKN
ncbi:uncharacterized protein LOC116121296 [Pistacia vera]|uniref:uncharacterized protein LOC116121296 n=1 Tax=Pistacia vera TaxID=55513 RepID=UPI001263C092|nr:uncharacterized protein LOC116121296 [Pistacia vera]